MRRKIVLLLVTVPAIAAAQSMPVLSSTAPYSLTLPYLEFSVAGSTSKAGYAATIKSTDLVSFTVDSVSVRAQTTFQNAVNAPQLTANGAAFQLTIPYLEFVTGGVARAYSATLTSNDLNTFTVNNSTIKEVATLTAPSAVAVTNVNASTVGSTSFSSSAKLGVSWKAPAGYAVDHYRIYLSETIGNTNVGVTAAAADTSATVSGLKASTTYQVAVKACKDSNCLQAGTAAVVSGKTSEEVWQLQGSGGTTAGLSKIVSDGNVRISATRFGTEAGKVTGNRIQLYYGPQSQSRQALTTALTSVATSATVPASYLSFVSSGATTGLLTPSPAATFIETIATGQGVPLSAELGGKVRLFFEAQGIDRKTRIFSIDSVDGYIGQDFNSDSPTTCSTTADYSSKGGCAFSVVIGVEGDSVLPNSKIQNARQNKVGFPTLTDWRWDGAPGTFMVFTSGSITGCTTAAKTHSYAVWDGSAWKVQYEANGCPKVFNNVQAAFPLHVGGVKYKLYYGDTSNTTGQLSSSLPFLGPKSLIYADGTSTGLTDRVDFEDWEKQAGARNVIFLWPNGNQLDSTAEGYIDDYHFMTPTDSLELQVMYLAITNGTEVPFASSAVLLNP